MADVTSMGDGGQAMAKAITEAAKKEKKPKLKQKVQPISPLGAFVGGVILIGAILASDYLKPWAIVLLIVLGLLVMLSIKIANQWEKAVVLRLGRLQKLKGPGPFVIIPLIDHVARYVDHRVIVTDVTAETALTKDTVPVDVDAIVLWLIWDAEKAVMEVQDFFDAVTLSAQTALRESIGRHMLAETITERESLGQELRKILDEKTNPWGITVQSVEIRDVKIPPALQDAMSRQAQAERERQARIILGTAETEISAKFAQASELYQHNPVALHLRAMNMLYEAIKEKGSMVIVPSSAVETMGLGGMSGLSAMAGQQGIGPVPPKS